MAKLLVPRLRPETLPDFLLELGRNGLGFAYVDGEPAVFPIGGTDHSTLRSMGLLAAWTHGLYAWESGTDRDPEDGDLDSAMKAVDDLWSRHDPLGRSLTPGQLASVRKFLDLLPLDAVTEAVEIAARKIPEDDCLPDRFRYFCGVCWGMIRERRALRSSCN